MHIFQDVQIIKDTNDPKQLPRPTSLILDQETIHWNVEGKEHLLSLDHIIGVSHVQKRMKEIPSCFDTCKNIDSISKMADSISSTKTGFWSIFAMVIEHDKNGDVQNIRPREIRFCSDDTECVDIMRGALGYNEKPIFFILNPFGGTKSSKKVYHRVVLPMLRIAGLEERHELVETEYSHHATEIAKQLDVTKYQSVVTISGDGVFHEVLNGLLGRKDWERAIKVPIGTIGSGSANAIGKNTDTRDTRLAVLNILKCKTRKADVFTYIQGNSVMYSHLMISWGFIADVDLESEKYRYLGEIRMTLMAVALLVKLRNYKGRIYCLTPEKADEFVLEDDTSHDGPRCRYIAPGSTNYKKWPMKTDSVFQYFLASNFPWISSDFLSAPLTTFDDGKIQMVYSEKMNRSNVLACVLDSERGIHLTYDFVEHFFVKAFVLEPLGVLPDDGSLERVEENLGNLNLDISGERVLYAPVQVEVLPRLMNLICPSWLDHTRWKKQFEKEFR